MKAQAVRQAKDLLITVLILAAATSIGNIFWYFSFTKNIISVYILGTLLTSLFTKSYFCGFLSSFSSVLLFNFCFTEPRLTLHAYERGYPVTFAIMLIVSIITVTLAIQNIRNAEEKERAAVRAKNEQLRADLLRTISHDLRTPLTSISGYAELIENGMAKQEDIPTFGHRIHKEAQRMITLVSDILQLSELDGMSKQQENSPTADFVPVDLGVLVKDVATNMTVNARKAYITLQYKVQPVTVRGSHDLLTELVTNLCDNAIRYNRPGGHVELSCGTNADGCPYFCVEDNGIGIPQDSQSRVFERFYRVDKSRSKATGGTGLGLAIVKHIAVLHGARIDLESTVGTGTTIRIIFPKM